MYCHTYLFLLAVFIVLGPAVNLPNFVCFFIAVPFLFSGKQIFDEDKSESDGSCLNFANRILIHFLKLSVLSFRCDTALIGQDAGGI